MVALHGGQVAKLPLLVQLGVAQQNQVVLLIQFAGDAGGDPDLVHPAGAQSLRGGVRAVACFFHHFPDGFPLLFTERPAVEISADCRAGHASHFCNVTDGHGASSSHTLCIPQIVNVFIFLL